MRIIANWISQLDGKRSWDEVKCVADRIFHADYALMKGGNEVPYDKVMASLEKMLVSGVFARLVKVRKVDDGIEGTWDSVYPDGRVIRLQSVWSFEDGKIIKSQHVRSQGSSPTLSTPRKSLSFEKELSALTEQDSSASSGDDTESSSLSDDADADTVDGEQEPDSPRSIKSSLKRVSSVKLLKSLQSQHRRKKALRQAVESISSSNIAIKS